MARILTILLVIIGVVGVIAGISFLTRSEEPAQSTSDDSSVGQRNDSRKSDATSLMASSTGFIAKNGSVPARYVAGALMGASGSGARPSELDLTIYKSVTIAQGKQAAVSTDELRLVTGATCGEKGATVVGSSLAVATQYTQEKSGGTFTAECLDS